MEKKSESGAKRIISAVVRPFTSVVTKVLLIAVLVCAVCGALWYGWKKFTQIKTEQRYALIEQQLTRCQELVTMKNRYSDIVSIKKSAALGMAKSYSIIKYTGIVRAGIPDISKTKFSVSSDGKSVTVRLPPAQLLGNDIMSQEVYDEHRNIFVPITAQEIFKGIEDSRREMADDLVSEGLLADADMQARSAVQAMMYSLGFESVIMR